MGKKEKTTASKNRDFDSFITILTTNPTVGIALTISNIKANY